MKRPAVLVLLLTFVALVAATLWVPARPVAAPFVPKDELHWAPVWMLGQTHLTGQEGDRVRIAWHFEPYYALWVGEYLVILALGGLLALALHTRGRRRAS